MSGRYAKVFPPIDAAFPFYSKLDGNVSEAVIQNVSTIEMDIEFSILAYAMLLA